MKIVLLNQKEITHLLAWAVTLEILTSVKLYWINANIIGYYKLQNVHEVNVYGVL